MLKHATPVVNKTRLFVSHALLINYSCELESIMIGYDFMDGK